MRHLEEGEIHAWLDGAVAADDAARIETHVASCAQCADEVATARGLIAGASRILLSLDSVPGGVIPAPVAGASPVSGVSGGEAGQSDLDRFRATRGTAARHTPWYARPVTRIAAGLVMAVGIGALATRDRDAASDRVTIDFRTEAMPIPLDLDTTAIAPSSSVGAAAAASAPPVSAMTPAVGAAGGRGVIADSFDADGARRGAVRAAVTVAPRVAVEAPVPLPSARITADRTIATAAGSAVDARQSLAGKVTGAAIASAPPPAVAAPAAAGASSDSSIRLRRPSSMRLESVVVTGVTADPPQKMVFAVGQARGPAVGGACFALDVTPPAGSTGIPAVPRRLRIQLEASAMVDGEQPAPTVAQSATGNAQSGVANLQGSAAESRAAVQAAARSFNPAAVRPAGALPWTPIAGDSVVARWMTGADVVVFRLQVTGGEVKGTAAPQASTAAPSTVSGLRMPCGGGD